MKEFEFRLTKFKKTWQVEEKYDLQSLLRLGRSKGESRSGEIKERLDLEKELDLPSLRKLGKS